MKQEMIRHDFVTEWGIYDVVVLCKLIAYNLCNLVHCKMEFGVTVDFMRFN